MTKKKSTIRQEPSIIDISLNQMMEDRYSRYSKYILQDRAIPDIRDGLKPVQRRILFSMYEDGNLSSKPTRKSAKTVGSVMGNYHPHGDSSIYEAMVNMSQWWKMGTPLIEMQGNNGSIDGDSAAAMRYTETRLSKVAESLLQEINENTVDFKLNYDDSLKEPMVLPAKFCNLLVNGGEGIATGYATKIPPFNFTEVMNASIYRLINPTCTDEEIFELVLAPDFPTGGIIEGKDEVRKVLSTGSGSFVVRSKVEIDYQKKITQLVVTEICYGVKKEEMVKKIADVRNKLNLDDILEIRDESDHRGIRVVIDIKKEADAQTILNILYKETQLQISYSANMTVIKDRRPQQVGIIAILDSFLEFRKEVVTRRTQYRYDKISDRLHILEGLMKAISLLDEVIQIIRSSKNKRDSKDNLIDEFNFSEAQAESIVTLQLYRLSNTDIVELKEEFAGLLNDLEFLKSMLSEPSILNNEIVKEFKEMIKLYDQPRITELKQEVKEIVINREALINDEQVFVTLSKHGYVKKVSLRSFAASDQKMTTIKEDDELVGQIETSTLHDLLVFTRKGNYFQHKVNDLPDFKWKDVGSHFSAFVSNESNDHIVSGFVLDNFMTEAEILLVTKLGKVKKVSVDKFQVQRTNRSYKAMNLEKQDEIVAALLIQNTQAEVLLLTKNGYCVRYSHELISSQGLNASGVKAINLQQDDVIVDASIYTNQSDLVFLCEDGQMKRLKENEVSVTGRPTRGNLIAKRIKTNPNLLKEMMVANLYDLIPLYSQEPLSLMVKDVKLMGPLQTFSKTLEPASYLLRGINVIPYIRFEKKETQNEHFEQVSFSLDD